jgi:hypothetical protein
VNLTGAGRIKFLAELVPSGPDLKNSVSISGEMTSISLAEGSDEELFCASGLGGRRKRLLVVGGTGGVGVGITTVFVSGEFGFGGAISVEFVGAGCLMSTAGSVKEKVAVPRENRSGGGPI